MNRSAAEEAYDALHEMIASGAIAAGQQIVESTIANALGMSRTPVREALRRLQQDGLVEIIRNKGCFLKRSSFADLANSYEMIALFSAMASRHLALNYSALDADDLSSLQDALKNMEHCLSQNNIRGWVEQDIQFHRLMIEMANIPQLTTLYDHLRLCITQVLWLVTPSFVDHRQSTQDHYELLDLIAQGNSEESFLLSRQHHMRTAEIIRNLEVPPATPFSLGEPHSIC